VESTIRASLFIWMDRGIRPAIRIASAGAFAGPSTAVEQLLHIEASGVYMNAQWRGVIAAEARLREK